MTPAGNEATLNKNSDRHVLIITRGLAVPLNRRVWQQAVTLKEAGYSVSVISSRGAVPETLVSELEGIRIFRYPYLHEAATGLGRVIRQLALLAWEFLITCRAFFTIGIDVIHACNPPSGVFLVGAFFKAFYGKKLVFDYRVATQEEGRNEGLACRAANLCLAASDSLKQRVVTLGKIPPERICVMRTAPDPGRIKPVQPVPSFKSGCKYLAGYAGVMDKEENLQQLIEAARIITQDMKRKDVHFLLAGGGKALRKVKKLAALQGVTEFVTFMDKASREELQQALSTADICVEPTTLTLDGQESQLLEYMALGRPIVQFDSPERRAITGEAALYATPNDASDLARKMVDLLTNPKKRKDMGDIARGRVENGLSWAFEAPKLLAAYEALFAPVKSKKS